MTRFKNSYADFGVSRSIRQIKHALAGRSGASESMKALYQSVETADRRMTDLFGSPIKNCDILELGPGQGFERAYYFGRDNSVTTMDLDVIPQGLDPRAYLVSARTNGVGRAVKTFGRELLIGRSNRRAWFDLIDASNHGELSIERTTGDICETSLPPASFDIVMSWSVFEHLPDPRAALRHLIDALRPGGIVYISVHLYTSNNGHHDIRAFTGDEASLPLWGHLRDSTRDEIHPSSFLNEWRLDAWRQLFDELAPGHVEFVEQFEHPDVYGPSLEGSLRKELSDYSDEELLTVNLVCGWKKPGEGERGTDPTLD